MSEQENVEGWSWDETLIKCNAVSRLSVVTFALFALSVFNRATVSRKLRNTWSGQTDLSQYDFSIFTSSFKVWDEILIYVFMSFANLTVVESCYNVFIDERVTWLLYFLRLWLLFHRFWDLLNSKLTLSQMFLLKLLR